MIQISAQTQAFHAIKFVEAIRRATGIGLADALDHVRRLSEGESLVIEPAGEATDEEVASWLLDCGVVAEICGPDTGNGTR